MSALLRATGLSNHGVTPTPTCSIRDLRKTFKGRGIPLCLHGTDQLPDELFRECISSGISKVLITLRDMATALIFHQFNINSWARDPYVQSLTAGLQSKPFPEAVEDATEVFAKQCDRFLVLFGSAGKA